MMVLPRPYLLSEMSEEARRQKLARARKMLREFQLRNNLPIPPRAKKKKKTKVGPETPTSGGHSPEDAPKDRATPASPADDTTPPGSAHPACASSPCTSGMASPENYDAERSPLPSEESKTMSSTDSLPQVSRPLHGLLPESSSNISGKDQTSSNDMKNPESRYQDLSLGLDSSSPTHNQLTKKTQELNQEKQDALDQLEIVKQDFEQELMKEQGALRQQLQEHTQTIEILLSEKSELHTALMHTQQALRQKAGEAEALANRLQSSRRRVSELEQTLSDVSAQQKQADKTNQELTEEHENLKVELCTQSKSNEALKQRNSELEETLRVLLMEKSAMQQGMDELHKKLQMRELAKPPPLQPEDLHDNQQLRQTLEEWETPPQKPPTGTSEMEQQLQAEASELQEKLEISGEIDTIREYIALHQNQRAVMKELHHLQEDISCITNDKEDMMVKLPEMQELNKTLVGEHKGQHSMFLAAAQSPAGQDKTASPDPQELGAHNGQDLPEGNLANDVGSVKGEAHQGKTVPKTSTAQQKMQLLRENQYTQDHHGLGDNPCIPFFYQAEKYEEAKVLVI
ncbi:golgin subfamily A member 2-like [Tamandua tetradactyla]|uniref:golgin subfamily A member 2-like n=1 Tax=Tamandua tetradactyla TaxID=48850 RepID=UPI0040549D88